MPSINQMRKKIIDLQMEIIKPKSDNWKHNHPHWKYDILFTDWLVYEWYSKQNPNDVDDYGRKYKDYPMSWRGKPFNPDELEDALNYFEENNINPIDDGYLETFVMFVCGDCPAYWESNEKDLPDEFYNKWNAFLKTHDFKLFVEVWYVLIEDITKLYMRGDITVTEYYDLIIKCEILNCLVDINEVLADITQNI